MLFKDDLVFVDELRVGVNAKLKRESKALESRGFKISHTKTIYESQLQWVYTKS